MWQYCITIDTKISKTLRSTTVRFMFTCKAIWKFTFELSLWIITLGKQSAAGYTIIRIFIQVFRSTRSAEKGFCYNSHSGAGLHEFISLSKRICTVSKCWSCSEAENTCEFKECSGLCANLVVRKRKLHLCTQRHFTSVACVFVTPVIASFLKKV